MSTTIPRAAPSASPSATGGGHLGQSARGSLVEASVNVGLGFIMAVVTQRLVFPLAGLHVALSTDLLIASAFTLVSLARTFAVRRLFEWLGSRKGHGGRAI